MKPALVRPLVALAVCSLPALPAAAAPSAGAEQAAAATFPLTVGSAPAELHLTAEPGRLVLDLYDEAGLERVTLPLQDGQLVLSADTAQLDVLLDGVPLRVSWEKVSGHYALGTGSVVVGPSGASYRAVVGEYARAVLQLASGSCEGQWGSLGRSPHVASDASVQDDAAALAGLLATAGCGESTATSVPPEG